MLLSRRRVVGVSFLVALAASVAGCNSETKTAEVDLAAKTISKIDSTKRIVVGVKFDSIPYGFVPQGQDLPIGFDIDLVREIAKRWGVEVELQPVTSANRIANLTSDKVDFLAASLVHTRERDQKIDYSITYMVESMKLMVPADSPVKTAADLSGKTVAVAQGSIHAQIMRKLNPEARVLEMKDWADVYLAVQQGRADAAFDTAGSLGSAIKAASDAGVKLNIVGEDGVGSSPFGLGVRQGDSGLRDRLNFTLMEMVQDGTYATIFNKWWKGLYNDVYQVEIWPK